MFRIVAFFLALALPVATPRAQDDLVGLYRDDLELVPPDYAGGRGLTVGDLEYYLAFDVPLDPMDMELVPGGLTQGELDLLIAFEAKPSPEDLELVPPKDSKSFGLTAAELDAIIAATPALSLSEIEAVPPDESGGVRVTLADLEAMPQTDYYLSIIELTPLE